MNSPFPKEISPSPIVSSTIEIRFTSNLNESDVLSFFYPIFATKLPEVKGRPFPAPFSNMVELNPQLKYWADYILSNKEYSVLVGRYVMAFNIVNAYTLWSNYRNFISECLKELFNRGRIQKVERISARYINLFENEIKIESILDTKLNFPSRQGEYSIENEKFSANISKNDMTMLLQIAENVQLATTNKGNIKGVYVDIDASQSNNLSEKFDESVLEIIEKLHTEAKTIFFLSIKSEYVNKKLNPKY